MTQGRALRNHLSGAAAEEAVARHYAAQGAQVLARRWRGKAGEIDLIARQAGEYLFIEVKASRTGDAALARVSSAQARRIMMAAQEFLAGQPEGQLAFMRFDVAAVDGQGAVTILPNAFQML